MNIQAIAKAVKVIGGPNRTARILGMKPSTVSQWYSPNAAQRRPLPDVHCPQLEFSSKGAATCEEMRPDIAWVRVPDPTWPNPAGRPLVDHMAKCASNDEEFAA